MTTPTVFNVFNRLSHSMIDEDQAARELAAIRNSHSLLWRIKRWISRTDRAK